MRKTCTKHSRPTRRNLLCVALGLAFSISPELRAQQLPAAALPGGCPSAVQEQLLAVSINDRPASDFSPVLWSGGQPYGTATAWSQWRLKQPTRPAFTCRGDAYFALAELPRLHWTFDQDRQALALQVPLTAFVTTDLHASGGQLAGTPERPAPGAFFNYNLQVARDQGHITGNGAYELGLFAGKGVLTSRMIQRDTPGLARWLRLDTAYTVDDPAAMRTLRIGDSVARASAWGRQFYFGGVQWSTNFATNPGFLPLPLPSLTGVAVQPSTVDLYINNSLRYSHDLDTGPFDINQVPVITGAGEMRMVVRDLAGRQQVVSLPYYASPALLKAGLRDFSVESGLLRQNIGTTSNDYRQSFLTATHRYGVTDRLTVDGRLELSPSAATGGAGLQYLLGGIGVLGGGIAASHSVAGTGQLAYAQVDHRGQHVSVGGRIQAASNTFYQLGMSKDELPARVIAQSYLSVPLSRQDSLSVSWMEQLNRSQPATRLFSVGYTTPIGKDYALSVSGFRSLLSDRQWGMGLTLTHTLGGGRLATGMLNAQSQVTQAMLDLSKPLPAGTGFGYRLRASDNGAGPVSANLQYQDDVGIYTAEAASASSARLTTEGGLVMMHGHTMLSRPVTGSFAMVEVPGHPGAQVYANNQPVTSTNGQGVALVTNLAPYVNNKINVDDRDMSVDTLLDQHDRQVVPYARSGVYLRFEAHTNRGAVIRLTDRNGTALPPGAAIRLQGDPDSYTTALRGEVYVARLQLPTHLRADWEGHHCETDIPFRELPPLPHIGPFACLEPAPAATH